MTKVCLICSKKYETCRPDSKFCGTGCAGENRRQKRAAANSGSLQCSECFATIGLGVKIASRLLWISKGRLMAHWRQLGIKAQVPPEGSWHSHAKTRLPPSFRKWWGDEESERLWLSQVKAKFPDWSSIWNNERSRRHSANRYQSMSEEERKAWNKALWEKRKADPLKMERQRDKIKQWKKRNLEKNRSSVSRSIKARKRRDPGFKIVCNLRNRLREIMGVTRDSSKKWNSALIGCDTHHLARHLESQFRRGMSWDNYGTHWHVDHIQPCSSFDHTNPEHVRRCWHFTNLRPMWAKENIAKGAKITEPQMQLAI